MKERDRFRTKIELSILSVVTVVAIYFGWRLFWFLTDDAFIAFRYISNSHLGYGYVWNAPPFRAVEGYTSFLWVVLLDLIWRVSGSEPPAAANYVSLFFTCLTLWVGGGIVWKMELRESLAKHRVLLLALVLLGVITNRTFLAWSSSGLETAMFNFFLTLWIYCCLFVSSNSRLWVFSLTLSAALIYLTRPDGLLFAVVTMALVVNAVWDQARAKRATVRMTLWAAPILLVPAHILWRRAVYGAWLPNTYYAKSIAGRFWIESGARYCLSFVMEYSLWIWLVLLLVVIVGGSKRVRTLQDLARVSLLKVGVCLALLGHFLYYTIVIGGDSFEYRVYSHLVLLIFVSFVWLLNAVQLNAKAGALLLTLFIVFSWPIPWLHWLATHNLTGYNRTVILRVSVARTAQKSFPGTPTFVIAYLGVFDRLQSWLISHRVCIRHQEHKAFYLHQRDSLPSRAEGLKIPHSGYPVLEASAVGVLSWVLPNANIIDTLGLNDYVVARNPDLHQPIQMAHERRPPPGYSECFSPNVIMEQRHFVIITRGKELTAERIVACEAKYTALVRSSNGEKREAPPVDNPIDDPQYFVRRQYLDVLDREPDPDGLLYWADHLVTCPTGSYCFNDSRISIPLILSDASEFRETAQFVYRVYAVSFGTVPPYADFMRDRSLLATYHVDWQDPDDFMPTHRSFIESWVHRDSFRALYPDSLSDEEFVNRIFDNANLKSHDGARKDALGEFRAGKKRAQVLSLIVENEELKRYINERSVVPMQLLMQLRRDVNNDESYKIYLEKLKAGDFVSDRHVICLILTSREYQLRFGDVVTHSNAECP